MNVVAHHNVPNYNSKHADHVDPRDNHYAESVYARVPFISDDAHSRENNFPKRIISVFKRNHNSHSNPNSDTDTPFTASHQCASDAKPDTYQSCDVDAGTPYDDISLSRVDYCDTQLLCVKSIPRKGRGKGKDKNKCLDSSTACDLVNNTQQSQNNHYYRNREKILAYAKIRYQENREKLLEYSKQYQSERKDLVKDRNDAYYVKHRDRLLQSRAEKMNCTCGKTITKGSIASHLKTKYHLKRTTDGELINNVTQEVAEMVAESALSDE